MRVATAPGRAGFRAIMVRRTAPAPCPGTPVEYWRSNALHCRLSDAVGRAQDPVRCSDRSPSSTQQTDDVYLLAGFNIPATHI